MTKCFETAKLPRKGGHRKKKIYFYDAIKWTEAFKHFVSCLYVVLLFYVHGKHLRSCRDGQLT